MQDPLTLWAEVKGPAMSGMQLRLVLPSSSGNSGSQSTRGQALQRQHLPVATTSPEGPLAVAAAADKKVGAATDDIIPDPLQKIPRSKRTSSLLAARPPAASDLSDAPVRGLLSDPCLIGTANGDANISVFLVKHWGLERGDLVKFQVEVNGEIQDSYPVNEVKLMGCSTKRNLWVRTDAKFMKTVPRANQGLQGWRMHDGILTMVLSCNSKRMTNDECMVSHRGQDKVYMYLGLG